MHGFVLAELGKEYRVSKYDPDQFNGFYYPVDYVIQTWLNYNKHGEYPNGLSYDEQDEKLMHDWRICDERRAYHARELRNADEEQ